MSSTRTGINVYWVQKEWERQCRKNKPEVLMMYFIDVPASKKPTTREKDVTNGESQSNDSQ